MHLSRRTHGVLDYVVGLILILAPRLLGFNDGTAAQYVPMTLGFAALIYSAFTNYELGLFKVLPFRAHLTLDGVHGLFLALSPWLFGFADRVWIPHVVLGVAELGVVLLTRASVPVNPSGPRSPAHL
jgi:hypothetical protein